MSELKPCPFCGNEVEMRPWKYNHHLTGFIYDFFCGHCGCSFTAGYCETEDEAIVKWNTRAERTCRNVSIKHEGVFICSDCGVYLDIAYMEDAETDYEPKFCPNCGAKAVKE